MKSIRSFAFLISLVLLGRANKSLQETVTVISETNVTRIIYLSATPFWNGIKFLEIIWLI